MGIVLANNAQSTLLAGVTSGATTLTVQTADASLFPALTNPGDYFIAAIEDTTVVPVLREIVQVTARSANTMTIVRATEGTPATAFSSGATFSMRLTAAALLAIVNSGTVAIPNASITTGMLQDGAVAGSKIYAPDILTIVAAGTAIVSSTMLANNLILPGTSVAAAGDFTVAGVLHASGSVAVAGTVSIGGSAVITGGVTSASGSVAGTLAAGAIRVTGTALPADGLYLPGAHTPALAVNSVRAMTWSGTGFSTFTTTENPVSAGLGGLGYSSTTQTLGIYSGTACMNLGATFNGMTAIGLYYSPAGSPTLVGSVVIGSGSVTYNTTSDEELKDKFGRLTAAECGSMVDAMQAWWFRWKGRPDEAPQPGFMAQELYRAYPWAVHKGTGKPEDADYIPWQVDQSKVGVLYLAELQFLRARVHDLETQHRSGLWQKVKAALKMLGRR